MDAVAQNRSLKPVTVRGLIDKALFHSEEAKSAGLVDHLEYPDEFRARIQEHDGVQRTIVKAKVGKRFQLQAGGFAGMMALVNEIFGMPTNRLGSKKPKIAIVYGEDRGSLFGGDVITSDGLAKLFRKVREDDSVETVVFRVNSPGGSALASELSLREVQLTAAKKPVVVSMGDLAASGGYYVSCGATWIVAEQGTLTGSIGVIGAVPNTRNLHDMIGVRYETFSRGKRKNMISAYGELSDDGREVLMRYIHQIYDEFLSRVAEGRKLPKEAAAAIAEGRVWTGGQALKHGLVDELSGLNEALVRAREMGKVPDDAEIISLPRPKTFFEVLQDLEDGTALKASVSLVPLLPDDVKSPLRHAEWIRAADKERVFTVMPEIVVLR